jgi:uncharacterized protein (DUF1778 family)
MSVPASRSEPQSALTRAEETLADRRHFGLSAEVWVAFIAALDAPPHRPARLDRLLNERSVFERAVVNAPG